MYNLKYNLIILGCFMKLKINNVGVIQDSEIKISGLTVITGDNNSGKSTVGKVISSIVSTTIGLKEKALREKVVYSNNIIFRVFDLLTDNVLFRNRKNRDYILINFPILGKIMNYKFLTSSNFSNIDELRDYLIEMKKEIESIDYNFLLSKISERNSKNFTKDYFYNNKKTCISKLNNLIEVLYDDVDLSKFSSQKILEALNISFKEQIAPVKFPNSLVEIVLKTKEETFYDITILNEKINEHCFIKNPFKHCFLINDVNIIDKLSYYKDTTKKVIMRSIISSDYYSDMEYLGEELNENLLFALTEKISSFEAQTYKHKFSKYIDCLNDVFSEDIVFVDGKYVCKDNFLDVRNLATGSKLFAIIKLLLEHGKIDNQTLIVLDEPENHLHPQWQLQLAKLIVMLTKDLNAKFVITTHSPSFLLAIDTYSKEFEIDDITNYYHSERCENDYNVKLENVNCNKDKIHYAINKPYIDISNLFDKYFEE